MMKRAFGIMAMGVAAMVFGTAAYAQQSAPTFSLSANVYRARPGDVITFTINEKHNGTSLDRREFTFDGFPVDWKDQYKWTATPGTHVLRLYLRWVGDDSEKVYLEKFAVVHVSGWRKEGGYNHPGLSLSEKEMDRIKANVSGEKFHPMKDGWKPGRFRPHTPQPQKNLNMDNKAQKSHWDRDGKTLYKQALRWVISGDDRYADNAVEIMMAWANTCEQMIQEASGVYQFLHATHFMGDWLEAAEILKHYHGGYKGWSETDRKKFDRNYVRKHLVPLALAWQGNIGNPFETQNQPLNVARARIMLGIYLDDEALFQSGYGHMFDRKLSNRRYRDIFGANPICLMELSIGPNGEYMEINRDPGHMGMCVSATQVMAEVLWHQRIDMYGMKFNGESTPRLLKGVGWLTEAAYGGAPTTRIGMVELSPGRIGAYEIIGNHYHYRLRDKYPLTKKFVEHVKRQRALHSSKGRVLTHANLSRKK